MPDSPGAPERQIASRPIASRLPSLAGRSALRRSAERKHHRDPRAHLELPGCHGRRRGGWQAASAIAIRIIGRGSGTCGAAWSEIRSTLPSDRPAPAAIASARWRRDLDRPLQGVALQVGPALHVEPQVVHPATRPR